MRRAADTTAAGPVEARVEAARRGENPAVICQLPSGWLVMGDRQLLPGYCVLLADPVVESLNALGEAERARYGRDMVRVGDALLAEPGVHRINYETWCNLAPSLHTHITPRYASEPAWRRRTIPTRAYPRWLARRFDPARDGPFMARMRERLAAG